MGYILSGFTSQYYDDTQPAASVGAGGTLPLITKTGKGQATIVVVGDGHAQVDIAYSVDGAADVIIGDSAQEHLVPVAFQVSLDVKAINNDGITSHNHSSTSETGALN